MKIICPYCNEAAKLVKGKDIYTNPKPSYANKSFWLCKPCNAYVGCHPNTDTPLGTLADANTRLVRGRAHVAFDPIWQKGLLTRSEAYKALATKLNIPAKECHIGMSSPAQCFKIIKAAKQIIQELKNS